MKTIFITIHKDTFLCQYLSGTIDDWIFTRKIAWDSVKTHYT